MTAIPFQAIDWQLIESTVRNGVTGTAYFKTLQFPGLQLRIVEYSPGYFANHWCSKGHIVYCLEGSFTSELKTGEKFLLNAGMSYIVSDELSEHRSSTDTGVKLLIIDGNFLK